VNRDELTELHFITPISNILSICQRGILSHRLVARIVHASIALEEVQGRRAKVKVPGGRPLHEYANLYFHARNPMLYKRLSRHAELCIVRVSPAVLDLEGVVVTDVNAASNNPRFAAAPDGLKIIDRELTFAIWWDHPDFFEKRRRTLAKCAEVLVPYKVPTSFLLGAYVSCDEALAQFNRLGVSLAAEINRHLFFR
jgi:hypothetical protein